MFHKCVYCRAPAVSGDRYMGHRCSKHSNPNYKTRQVCNVYAYAGGMKRWVHPSNLRANGSGQYEPQIMKDHLTGRPFCQVRFFAARAGF